MDAVVTGGSNGIGAAIAAGLIRQGLEVLVIDVTKPPQTKGLSWLPGHLGDLAHPESLNGQALRASLRTLANHLPHRPRILVNNVGLYYGNGVSFLHETSLHGPVFDVNYVAPLVLAEFFTGLNPKIRTLNITSIAGLEGGTDISYAASKAALINATKSLGLAGRDVFALAPRITSGTELFERIPEAIKRRHLEAYGQKEFETAEDVALQALRVINDAPPEKRGTCYLMTDTV